MTEIAIKGSWYANEFWPWHWARAEHEPQPPGPFAALRKRVRTPPGDDFARQALREAMRRVSDLEDTHPVLRDRLEALGQKAAMPEWSMRPALELLADRKKWIEYFDSQWRRAHAADWKQHHAHRARIRERIAVLGRARRAQHAGRDGRMGRFRAAASTRQLLCACAYESALQIAPEHPGALRGLAQMLPASDREARLAVLERLHGSGAASRWWAARSAVASLEDPDAGPHDEEALSCGAAASRKQKRPRSAPGKRSPARRFSARSRGTTSTTTSWANCGLTSCVACPPRGPGWCARTCANSRGAVLYIVFVELPGLDDEDRWNLCRQLEQTLTLPGAALVLWAGHSPKLEDIEREAFGAVWTRGA